MQKKKQFVSHFNLSGDKVKEHSCKNKKDFFFSIVYSLSKIKTVSLLRRVREGEKKEKKKQEQHASDPVLFPWGLTIQTKTFFYPTLALAPCVDRPDKTREKVKGRREITFLAAVAEENNRCGISRFTVSRECPLRKTIKKKKKEQKEKKEEKRVANKGIKTTQRNGKLWLERLIMWKV